MVILPMPVISFDGSPYSIPNWANFDYSGAYTSAKAISDVWGGTNYGRCELTPNNNANSGPLYYNGSPQPYLLTLALHNVPLSQRTSILVLPVIQDWVTGDWDCSLIGHSPNNVPTGYQIRGNPAAIAGSPPSSGWTTLVTVTAGEPYHSRQHYIADFSSYNWLQVEITDIAGSGAVGMTPGNNNAATKIRIHNAGTGLFDDFWLIGDSITSRGAQHTPIGSSDTLERQINALYPKFYPVYENIGEIGYTTTDVQALFASTWLPLFPGKNIVFQLGTNDANGGGALMTNYVSKMTSLVTSAQAAGKSVWIADPPWGATSSLQANIPTIIAYNAAIRAATGAGKGPDYYTPFNADHTLIDPADNIHPTDPAIIPGAQGYPTWRSAFVNWAKQFYQPQLQNIDTRRKHRTVVF